jgi:signal transduction histidine kinase
MSLSYVFVALVCVALISILTNFLLEKQFTQYIIQNQENKNKTIASQINQQYKEGGKWERSVIENIGVNALESGIIVKVTDLNGKVIWDATVYNNGLCQQMIAHMSHNMLNKYPNWKGEYTVNEYPVTYSFKQVGTVQIGYYGPYYFNDNDLAFINTLNKILVAAGIFSLLIALLTGAFMAKRLSMPISRVIKSAQMISKGYYNDRIADKAGTKEIYQLTATINNLAETLEKQEILRKRLTADVAHELRTPLATLQGHMEAMIDGIWKPDVERLKSCHDEIIRINGMVGDLEKLARYESENLVLNITEFDVSELIRHIIANFEFEFANKKIDLRFNGEEIIVHMDKDKISQVIINLLSNAFKYTPEGGSAQVSLKEEEDNIIINVSDNGIGIPADDLPYIFERFYRADKSRNRMTGGAGIGLTISKAIIDAHGGAISVKSELNKGTEFTVKLPVNSKSK